MEEAITFWLDNKICSGFKVAEIGRQTLVSYRDKFYLVENGAARMNGVRPLHYSKTSMPLVWKKAIKGILPAALSSIVHPEDENLPVTTSSKKERITMPKTITSLPESSADDQLQVSRPAPAVSKKSATAETKPVKIAQTVIAATCPYCSHKQDLPFEKGKNGKPFFVLCVRCSTEFAVRFVPVTMYQAQVAAFK